MPFIWKEELPDNCPPDDAISPDGKDLFRLVSSKPPSDNDFDSYKTIYPYKQFSVSDCQAKSISVLNDLWEIKKIRKLPIHKNKMIVRLQLERKDGLIKQTGNINHFSWWVSKYFSLNQCEYIE